jgi:glycosyltransferase involved in cell wall biosynthesis
MSQAAHPHLRIIYWRLSGYNGEDQFIGGVETYIHLLAECCNDIGMAVTLYQLAEKPFQRTIGPLVINGVHTSTFGNTAENRTRLTKAAFAEIDLTRDILLYAADEWSVKTEYSRAILIQHGIGWDKPIQFLSNRAIIHNNKYMERLKRWKERRSRLKTFENCPNRVCVDYNFLNWYRTYRTVDGSNPVWVIPNAAPVLDSERIAAKLRSVHDNIRILFSRRFEPFRGTRLMGDVATNLLRKFPNIGFTFAGEGSDKVWLQECFKNEPRVTICKIDYDRRMEAYFQYDIVVIPSYGSEGTSLSAIEAMGAGCAVVATDSGGITNIILDGFNGLLVRPDAAEIERSLTILIESRELRERIASAAHQTMLSSFSVQIWKNRWIDILKNVADSK